MRKRTTWFPLSWPEVSALGNARGCHRRVLVHIHMHTPTNTHTRVRKPQGNAIAGAGIAVGYLPYICRKLQTSSGWLDLTVWAVWLELANAVRDWSRHTHADGSSRRKVRGHAGCRHFCCLLNVSSGAFRGGHDGWTIVVKYSGQSSIHSVPVSTASRLLFHTDRTECGTDRTECGTDRSEYGTDGTECVGAEYRSFISIGTFVVYFVYM